MLVPVGCKRNDPATGITEPISKMALITGDMELEIDFNNAALWEGITTCGDANGIEYAYYTPEEITEDAISKQFEAAINDGAKVIICMGDSFADTISHEQIEHPDIKIIAIDISAASIGELEKNTHCVMFRQEQGGYLAGYGAVKDGFRKLGFMGLRDTETYASYYYGFIQGANDAAVEMEENVEMNVAFASDFDSEDDAIAKCDEWYKAGTEIIMVSGDDIFTQRCTECAVDNFTYVIGTNNDQSYIGSSFDYNPFMTSAMKGLREAVDATLEMMLAGEWDSQLGGQTVYFGLQSGNYIYLPDNESLWLFNEFTMENYLELCDKIASGAINVGSETIPKVNDEYFALHINGEETE